MSTFYRFPNGLRKALTLSYDDGVEQDVRLIDILDQYGIRATFNLNSGCWAPEGVTYPKGQIHRRMSKSQVEKVYANPNHEVAAHCLTHASLTELSPAEIAWEVLADRKNLEEMFGGLIRGLAYPFGTFSAKVVDALRANQYRDNFSLAEMAAISRMPMETFRKRFVSEVGMPPLSYVLHCKMERAKELLREEGHTVRQAGIEVGMQDPYHFSKQFKNIVGISPSAFMKQAAKPDATIRGSSKNK